MTKTVYDTNVIVSAQIKSGSWPALVLDLGWHNQVQGFASPEIIEEYRGVLVRKEFGFDKDKIDSLISLTKEHFEIIEPQQKVTAASDESDNKFLECALEAKADFLVMGNKKDFPEEFEGIKIVGPKEFAHQFVKEMINRA